MAVSLLASVMVCGALAASSKESLIEVTGEPTITVTKLPVGTKEVSAEEAAEAIDKDLSAKDLDVVWEYNISAESYPCMLTVLIEGQPANVYTYVLHQNADKDWEMVGYGKGDKFEVEITEGGVYALVFQSASASVVPSGEGSDMTGENGWTVALAVAVALMAGTAAVISYRKAEI